MKFLLLFFLSLFLGMGCTSIPAPTAVSTSILTPAASLPTSTPVFKQEPLPSPTDIQLPYNPDLAVQESCKPPYAVLPVSDGNDISEDEIVYELLKIWLRQYKQPHMPSNCRIADYTIDKVYDDPGVYSKVLEPRGDFMRVVNFSVRLIQVPTDWLAFPGELDQDNWLHIGHVVAITKTSEGYQMEFAYP